MVSEDTPTNAHVHFCRTNRKQVQIIFSYTIKITFLFIYIIYRLYCYGLFKIYLPLSKKSVEPSSFFKTSTAEGIHIHIHISFLATKSPQLKTTCYLRKLVTVLYLFPTSFAVSVWQVHCY